MSNGEILREFEFKKGTGKIWLEKVLCFGAELNIEECINATWGNRSCNPSQDVGIVCNPKGCDLTPQINNGYVSTLLCQNTCDPGYRVYRNDSNGDMRCISNSEWESNQALNSKVRLADGGTNWGRAEVFFHGEWGTVCDDLADDNFAKVLCKELGMIDGTILKEQSKLFAKDFGQIWLDDVECTGTESSIINCTHLGWDCGIRSQLVTGQRTHDTKVLFGSVAKFTCNPGYLTAQNLATGDARCMPNGEWETVRCEQTGIKPVLVQCASSQDFNDVIWPSVAAGTVKELQCADGYTGKKTRECNSNGFYEHPVYNCTKKAIHQLLNKVISNVSADLTETINDLRNEMSIRLDTKNTSANQTTLHVGDIEAATKIMQLITDRIETNTSTIENVADSFVDVVDHLISSRTTNSWGALMDKGGAATVINVLDEFISKVANNSAVSKQNLTVGKENIFIEIGTVGKCSRIKFPDSEQKGNVPSWARNRHDNVEVACGGTDGLTFSGSLFRNMSSIMSARTEDTQPMEINAPVLSFTFHDSNTSSDEQTVTVVFELLNTALAKPSCRFWKKGNASVQGHWSSEGCHLVEFNRQTGRVTCSCNHLTNFAVLMSPEVTVEKIHYLALSAITVVGCCMSMAGLVTTSVIYIYFWRTMKSYRATMLLNLCAALFIAYLAFMIGIERTQTKAACTFTAVLLHYVYLVAFFLMLAEGGVIALMVLRPLGKRDFISYFLAGAYGIPFFIVGISMGATQLEGYGNERFCWLTVESGLFWTFARPVLVIVMTNIIIMVFVLKQLFGVSAMSKKTDAEKIKTGVRSVCILLPVLGLTWVFGIFAVNRDTLVFQYLFAIFNSLQGFLIFLVQCVFDRKVRDALRQTRVPWFTTTDVRTGDTEMRSRQKSTTHNVSVST